MEFLKSTVVTELLKTYPTRSNKKLLELRQLVISTATDLGIAKLVETTKWGEPSYVTKSGSTIRMDWKPKTPNQYFLYFICSTELVNTFKIVFGEELTFEGNRAIVLNLNEELPIKAIQKCISLALTYHKIKHLPLLGV